jgi:hypothetical protein
VLHGISVARVQNRQLAKFPISFVGGSFRPANDNFNALLARPKGRAYNNFTKNLPQCTDDLKCCSVENC